MHWLQHVCVSTHQGRWLAPTTLRGHSHMTRHMTPPSVCWVGEGCAEDKSKDLYCPSCCLAPGSPLNIWGWGRHCSLTKNIGEVPSAPYTQCLWHPHTHTPTSWAYDEVNWSPCYNKFPSLSEATTPVFAATDWDISGSSLKVIIFRLLSQTDLIYFPR